MAGQHLSQMYKALGDALRNVVQLIVNFVSLILALNKIHKAARGVPGGPAAERSKEAPVEKPNLEKKLQQSASLEKPHLQATLQRSASTMKPPMPETPQCAASLVRSPTPVTATGSDLPLNDVKEPQKRMVGPVTKAATASNDKSVPSLTPAVEQAQGREGPQQRQGRRLRRPLPNFNSGAPKLANSGPKKAHARRMPGR